MTSKGAKKRRYLDDTNVIHIVNQPTQYNGGEIKQSPGKIRQLTDNIAGSVKQQLSGNAPVSPYLAYPAAGIAATAMFNPITTLASVVKGGIGGAVVNKISKKLTNKTWGENVERVLDINPDVAEFTNPGYFLGAGAKIKIAPKFKVKQTTTNNAIKKSLSNINPKTNIINDITKDFNYNIKDYPGYQLKALMKGNTLEKQLSNSGTIDVNNIKSYFAKSNNAEKEIINRVLASKDFVNKKVIDYNNFRKAVQDEIIVYDRRPSKSYEDYGIDRLNMLEPTGFEQRRTTFGHINVPISEPTVKFNTFTFESPKVGLGNDTHYFYDTLGHSRTYTAPNEPEVLHVMESQSDWGQSKLLPVGHRFIPTKQESANALLFNEAKTNFVNNYPEAQVKYLHDNYIKRQLQENLKYAAQQGQTKMRYPTRETAAKIEGYPVTAQYGDNYNKLLEEYKSLDAKVAKLNTEYRNNGLEPISQADYRKLLNNKNDLKILLDKEKKNVKLTYAPQYETILKKYSSFPKLYNKLYKDADIRIVTDNKGNSWYEVDVPKNYLNSEWEFKYGGLVTTRPSLKSGGSIYIKPSHRGRLTELKARTGKSESELYNDGNPAHKKMVVFARNARKWHH